MATYANQLFDMSVEQPVDEKPSKPRGPGPCPKCGASVVLRSGPRGQFYGCSTYPLCRGVREYDPDLVPPPEPAPPPPLEPEPQGPVEWSVNVRTDKSPYNHGIYIDDVLVAFVLNTGVDSQATAKLMASAPKLIDMVTKMLDGAAVDLSEYREFVDKIRRVL